jgi:parvulin-like peptidyl-prolyl isomerase
MGNQGTAERRSRVGVGQGAVGVLAVVCVLACARDPGVIATYNGGTVTRDDLDDRALVLPDAHRPPQERDALQEWRRRLARQIVLERVLMPEEQLIPRVGTILEPGPWRRELVRMLIEREGLRRVDVPEDSVVGRYERDWARFFLPEGIVFQHVFLPFPSGGGSRESLQVRALAESVYTAAVSGTDFDELVNAYSRSESKQWGGRVGVVFRGQLAAELERVLFSLNEGEVGGPVATEHGYHVVKVLERRAEQLKPFEEAAPIIRHELLTERMASMRDAYFEALREEFPVTLTVDAFYDQRAADEEPILDVAGEVVTKGELAIWLARFPRGPEDAERLREVLEGLAVDAQLYRKALERGLAEDPIAVGRYRAAAGRAFIDSVLQRSARRVAVEEGELRAFYESHPRRFSEPKRWKVREIVLVSQDGSPYDAWQHANRIVSEARTGGDFAALARQYSDAPSAADGGDLGELTLEDTAGRGPEFQRCLFSLEEGDVSDVTRSNGGYIILKLERITEAHERPFEDVRDLVRREYIRNNRSDLMEQEAERLAREVGFRFYGDER